MLSSRQTRVHFAANRPDVITYVRGIHGTEDVQRFCATTRYWNGTYDLWADQDYFLDIVHHPLEISIQSMLYFVTTFINEHIYLRLLFEINNLRNKFCEDDTVELHLFDFFLFFFRGEN